MTLLDLIAVAWIAFSCFQGARRGLVANALSLIGFAAGAVIGSRLAPHLLAAGAASPWLPAATLVAALVLGLVAQALAGTAAGQIRHHLLRGPLETVDTAGGLAVGAVFGVALVWLAAVVAVQQPMLGLRSDVQRSEILPALLKAVPASSVLSALAQFDPLPVIPSLADRSLPAPTPGAVPRDRGQAQRLQDRGRGLRPGGAGLRLGDLAAPDRDQRPRRSPASAVTSVSWRGDQFQAPGHGGGDLGRRRHRRDPRAAACPSIRWRWPTHDAHGGNVALIGYPENGGLTVNAGRAGASVTVITPDAYGNHVHARTVVPLRGLLRHGDSGGPVVNAAGRVVAMMFAADSQGHGGFGVPIDAIRALDADASTHAGLDRPLHQLTAASTSASEPIAFRLWPSRNTSACSSADPHAARQRLEPGVPLERVDPDQQVRRAGDPGQLDVELLQTAPLPAVGHDHHHRPAGHGRPPVLGVVGRQRLADPRPAAPVGHRLGGHAQRGAGIPAR